jgi:hypothetical protein
MGAAPGREVRGRWIIWIQIAAIAILLAALVVLAILDHHGSGTTPQNQHELSPNGAVYHTNGG